MKLFDLEKIGTYLDDIGHRVEKTKDGNEIKMVDLTLRVQPFGPELATSLDPDVRQLLFTMTDATPRPKIKSLQLEITVPRQQLAVHALPEGHATPQFTFYDVEITGLRARTEKGVDGFGLVFYASMGPLGPDELDFVCEWHTTQRFLTFTPQQPALDFAGAPAAAAEDDNAARHLPRRHPRAVPSADAQQAG